MAHVTLEIVYHAMIQLSDIICFVGESSIGAVSIYITIVLHINGEN